MTMTLLEKRKKSYVVNLLAIILLFILMKIIVDGGFVKRYIATIIVLSCINIIMATSLNLATGILGQLALGHAGFMAVGAYVTSLVAIMLSPLLPDGATFIISLLIGGAFTGLAGILIGMPALRLRGDYLGILTLGFGEIIKVFITNLTGITNGAQGLTGIPKLANFSNVFAVTIVVIFVINTLMRSRHGRSILSIREDEIASEAVGIKITKYKVMAFSISAMLGGIGGGLFALYYSFITPTQFGFLKSVDILVIVVLGGMGSITGSVFAAVVLTFIPELFREFEQYRMLIYAATLILMMIFRPQGLFGKYEFSLRKTIFKMKNRLNLKELNKEVERSA